MIIQCPTCQLRYDVAHRAPGTTARCRCGTRFRIPSAQQGSDHGVRCAGCGAKNQRQARTCAYCGVSMATASCPACLSLNPSTYRHCSQCGEDMSRPARKLEAGEQKTPLACPRCEQDLEAKLLADALVDQCPGCGGAWLDHDVLSRLLADCTRRQPVRERLMQMPAASTHVDTKKVVYLRCPECAVLMNRRNPAHRSGIIVDVCAAHGVWFDDRELAILLHMVSMGATPNVSPRPQANPAPGSGTGRTSDHAALPYPGAGQDHSRSGVAGERPDLSDLDLADLNLGDLLSAVGRLF